MKILIAEDEIDLQKSIATYLERDGNVCETASDYKEAAYKTDLYDYDLIILDVNLVSGSGLDVLKKLKKANKEAGSIIGMSILSNSLFAVLIMIPLFIFIYQAIVRAEENYLRNSYGAGYDDYCAKVNRWIPELKGIGKTFGENDFNLKKVAFKEYNTSYLWMLGATFLLAYNSHWLKTELTLQKEGLYFIMAITLLTLLYFTIRFFKKRERRIAREKKAEKQAL